VDHKISKASTGYSQTLVRIIFMERRTEEIKNRFEASWSETELFYDDLIKNYTGFDRLVPLRQFINKLRKKGKFKYFRLGTSMHTLVISRSVDRGLRLDQKHIKIEAIKTDDFEVTLRDGDKSYCEFRIKDLEDDRITKLLKTLKDTLVD
jgi:hypothetical protein